MLPQPKHLLFSAPSPPLPCPSSSAGSVGRGEGGSRQDHGYLADEIIIIPAASQPPLHSSVLTVRLILFSSTNIDSLGSFHLVPIKKTLLIVLLLNLFCSCEKHPEASRNSLVQLTWSLRAVCPQYPWNLLFLLLFKEQDPVLAQRECCPAFLPRGRSRWSRG